MGNLSGFGFPHFAIYSAKRFPSFCDGNTLHIKALWKTSFSERFLCKMSMLPKAARPFGSIISAIIKNGETQIFWRIVFFTKMQYNGNGYAKEGT